MAIVDDQGRLWGRWNLVDAVLVLLLLGLLPLGYGAYVMLRPPEPLLTAIEPTSLTEGPNLRVTVRGENLRPYHRVSFDTVQGLSFLFQDSTRAQIDLNPMPPGVYDVILYDFQQERMRLPKAFTLLPPVSTLPTTEVIVVGLLGLKPDQVAQIKPGLTVSPDGEVLTIGKAAPANPRIWTGYGPMELPVKDRIQLPIVIRVGCSVRAPQGLPECAHADFALRPLTMVVLETPAGKLPFQIDQLRGSQPSEAVAIEVRFQGLQQAVGRIRDGDIDVGVAQNELAAGAHVIRAGGMRPLSGDSAERDVTLRLSAQRTTGGWTYANGDIKVGGPFALRATEYQVNGIVLSLTPQK